MNVHDIDENSAVDNSHSLMTTSTLLMIDEMQALELGFRFVGEAVEVAVAIVDFDP